MNKNQDQTIRAADAAAEPDERPTFGGAVPTKYHTLFRAAPAPVLPEVAKLPAPRQRCKICGASRSWMLEANERAKVEKRAFLFRVRQPGRMKGACFVNVRKLLAFLAAEEAADHARDAAGADVETQNGTEVQP